MQNYIRLSIMIFKFLLAALLNLYWIVAGSDFGQLWLKKFAVLSSDDKATCVRALKSREWLMDKVITPRNIYSDICKKETHHV